MSFKQIVVIVRDTFADVEASTCVKGGVVWGTGKITKDQEVKDLGTKNNFVSSRGEIMMKNGISGPRMLTD